MDNETKEADISQLNHELKELMAHAKPIDKKPPQEEQAHVIRGK